MSLVRLKVAAMPLARSALLKGSTTMMAACCPGAVVSSMIATDHHSTRGLASGAGGKHGKHEKHEKHDDHHWSMQQPNMDKFELEEASGGGGGAIAAVEDKQLRDKLIVSLLECTLPGPIFKLSKLYLNQCCRMQAEYKKAMIDRETKYKHRHYNRYHGLHMKGEEFEDWCLRVFEDPELDSWMLRKSSYLSSFAIGVHPSITIYWLYH